MTMTENDVIRAAVRALVDSGALAPAARAMDPREALWQWAECNPDELEDELETFVCECGDVEYPLEPADDEDTWCECGLRLDAQRERLERPVSLVKSGPVSTWTAR